MSSSYELGFGEEQGPTFRGHIDESGGTVELFFKDLVNRKPGQYRALNNFIESNPGTFALAARVEACSVGQGEAQRRYYKTLYHMATAYLTLLTQSERIPALSYDHHNSDPTTGLPKLRWLMQDLTQDTREKAALALDLIKDLPEPHAETLDEELVDLLAPSDVEMV